MVRRRRRRRERAGEEQTKNPVESQTVVALFKMCTGTPHCGSGVQAADELLISTSSSVLMFPFSTQPSPPLTMLLSLSLSPSSHSLAACRSLRRRRTRQRQLGSSPILDGVCRTRAGWGQSLPQKKKKKKSRGRRARARGSGGGGGRGEGRGWMSRAGQTRSVIRQTEATERKQRAFIAVDVHLWP